MDDFNYYNDNTMGSGAADEQEGTAEAEPYESTERVLKQGEGALGMVEGNDKLQYAERHGAAMLDQGLERGEPRKIEDLKKMWRQKETMTAYVDKKSQATDG